MRKDTFWFNHDFNARNDERILELRSNFGAESYGVFWMLIETMAENTNGGIKYSLIGGLSLGYGVAKGRLKEIIDFAIAIGLFYEVDGFIFSKRFDKFKQFRGKFSEKGREGAAKRWGNAKNNGGVIGGLSSGNGQVNAKDNIREDNIGYNISLKKEEKTFGEEDDQKFNSPLPY